MQVPLFRRLGGYETEGASPASFTEATGSYIWGCMVNNRKGVLEGRRRNNNEKVTGGCFAGVIGRTAPAKPDYEAPVVRIN